MKVHDVMTSGVECTWPNDTIASAARKMKDLDVGVLPVCDINARLVGMITDRDITTRAIAGGRDSSATNVQDVMTPRVLYCFEDQDVADAADLMKAHQVRRLVVLNRDRRLVGIVSLGDLAVDTADEVLAGATLEAVSEPAEPKRYSE